MFKRKSVNVAALIALGVAAPVFAQQAAPAQQLERVEVTGSRIKTLNTETASPVISLGAEAIKVEGKRDVESLLNNLPQVFADQGGQVSNGSTGTATVNLRNLGADRTLVLINGRRMPAGSPRSLPADLNQIPVSLIKRVEVLTGGASAVYGSDAVAGVVNFVMNDKFEGVEVEANYSFFNHSQQNNQIQALVASRAATNPAQFKVPGDISADGKVKDFSLTMGSNFADNKGNATLFVGRKTTDALLQSERDFTACSLGYDKTASGNAFGGFSCGGSSTSFPGRILNLATGASRTVADSSGNIRPYVGATDQYNFGPLNYFQRPSDRTTAAAFAHYDLSDAARVYAELNFHDDSTVAQIAPSGIFFAGQDLVIRAENPLLSTAWKNFLGLTTPGSTADVWIGRRNVEGGGRQDDIRHTSYRGVVGVKGEINPALSYDAYVLSGRVAYQETYKNDFSNTRITRALDVVADASGNPVCRSKLDGTDINCVPYNIWRLGGVTPEALAYLQTPGFQKGFTSTGVTGATLSGDLTDYGIKSPMASSGLGFAVGLERRVEKMELSTDSAFTTGDLAGQGGPTIGVGGQYAVNDVFTELRMPLIEKLPFVEQLSLTASYRKSNYSTKKKTDTYGLGLEYSPIKEVKFRGSFQQASRAANVVELFSAQSLGLYNNDYDPCAGAVVNGKAADGLGATLAECARTGVTAAQFGNILDNPAQQYNQIAGGNPNLVPETAKSTTFGVIVQPMRNVSVSLDYFNIKVKDTIGTRGAVTILNDCLSTGSAAACSLVKRDSRGTLFGGGAYIINTNFNIGSLETSGVDLAADASFKLGEWGGLNLSVVGTFLDNYGVEENCAGKFGNVCGTPMPKWRHKIRTTWNTPWGVSLAATLRHIDSVALDRPIINGQPNNAQVASLAARDYLDLAASYKLTKNVTIRAAINNLLDKDPPIGVTGAPFGNGNTYPQVYEANGRQISLNVTAKF
jgi:outer membrane receptor protein involved in Fe transport